MDNDEYKWFKKIIESDLKDLNTIRKEIVHYTHLETKNFYDVMAAKSEAELKEIQKVKDSYPEQFQKILSDCLTAFVTAIKLMNKLPDKVIGNN